MKKVIIVFLLLSSTVFSQRWYQSGLSYHEPSNFKFIVEAGIEKDRGDTPMEISTLDAILSYQNDEDYSIGLGIGARDYSDIDFNLFPVYFDTRAYFNDTFRSVSPFIGIKLGYTFIDDDGYETYGGMIHPFAGVRKDLGGKVAINIGIGGTIQKQPDDLPNSTSFGIFAGIELL